MTAATMLQAPAPAAPATPEAPAAPAAPGEPTALIVTSPDVAPFPAPAPAPAFAMTQPPFGPFGPFGPSEEFVGLTIAGVLLTIVVLAIGIPLVRALGRKWSRQAESGTSPDVERRLARIEQAVESIALEVERIGEGQRYTNQVVSELRALPSGDVGAAEAALLGRAAREKTR